MILAFLNFSKDWNPIVFISYGIAVMVYMLLYHLFLAKDTHNPFRELKEGKEKLSADLIIGALLFGIGWGMTGMCPGPAVMSLVTFKPFALVFFLGMVLSMQLLKLIKNRSST